MLVSVQTYRISLFVVRFCYSPWALCYRFLIAFFPQTCPASIKMSTVEASGGRLGGSKGLGGALPLSSAARFSFPFFPLPCVVMSSGYIHSVVELTANECTRAGMLKQHTYKHASHTRVCTHVLGLYDLTQLLSDTNRACRILYVTLPAVIVLGSCDYLRAQIPVVFYGKGL